MVFGDLPDPHESFCSLSKNTFTKEYSVPWEITNVDV
jgi:hypothetical protein